MTAVYVALGAMTFVIVVLVALAVLLVDRLREVTDIIVAMTAPDVAATLRTTRRRRRAGRARAQAKGDRYDGSVAEVP